MLISTKGRYALRVMADLAGQPPEAYVPLKEIAQRQGISEKYLEAIIRLLVRDGLVSGLRGKGGGYRLTRPPERYTAGEVLRLTEGSLAPVACLEDGTAPCARAGGCPTLPLWQGLERVIFQYLEEVTIADLLRQADTPAGSGPDGSAGTSPEDRREYKV